MVNATQFDKLFVPLASSLIGSAGKWVKLTRIAVGDYNPVLQAQPRVPVTYQIKVVFSGIGNSGRPSKYDSDEFDADMVRAKTRIAYMAAADAPVAPLTGDILEADGVEYTVGPVVPTYSGELIAVYEMLLSY